MAKKTSLTDRQKVVLGMVENAIARRGYPPTLRELGDALGIKSTNGVNDHLKVLLNQGYLTRERGKSRSLRVVHPTSALGESMIDVPIVGRVAAGQPLLAVENIEDTVRVDRFFIGAHREVFALRVTGDSMIEDGIFDGDFIFVKKTAQANPGDIVVALIDEEATVKRYYPEGDVIRFQPAHPSMKPILVRRDEFRSVDLIGTVVGVYRQV